jgi:stress response protein YsnF
VAVGLPLADGAAAEPRREGEVWIIPIVEEVPVVTMQRMVTKEVRVTKRTVRAERTVAGTVRRRRVEVDAGDLAGRVHAAGTEPADRVIDGEEAATPSA